MGKMVAIGSTAQFSGVFVFVNRWAVEPDECGCLTVLTWPIFFAQGH